jgi:hypothetical protein
VVYYQPAAEGRPLLGGRVRRLLGGPRPTPYYPAYQGVTYHAAPAQAVVPAPYHAQRREVHGFEESAPPPVGETAPPPTAAARQEPLPLVSRKHEDKVGHEDDFSWITGQLFYVRSGGGRWLLRYGLPDQEDRFGGAVVLAPGVEMKNFREGDVVCVHGRLLNEGRTSASFAAPTYRVESITMVERSDQ